jgi:TPR repeat protein
MRFCSPGVLILCAAIAHGGERNGERAACPQEPDKFLQVEKEAGANNAEAQTQLASCYELGRNVAPSRAETIHWLSLAAAQGYAPAEYELGRIYLYGRGIPADYKLAMLWEEKAALQGEPKAQRDMAYIYERGLGVRPDPRQAAVWNRKAAQQGDAQAQLRLGEALEAGNGLSMSTREAKQWYLKAAKQNVPEAQLHLAQMYAREDRSGCGVALGWYRKAAGNAQAAAMYELGKLYQTVCGPDPDSAFVWFQIGARFGSTESRAEADKLSSQLNDMQRKKADAAVEAWIARHSGARKEADDD